MSGLEKDIIGAGMRYYRGWKEGRCGCRLPRKEGFISMGGAENRVFLACLGNFAYFCTLYIQYTLSI